MWLFRFFRNNLLVHLFLLAEQPVTAATRCEPKYSTELRGGKKKSRDVLLLLMALTATAISCVQEDFY